MTTTFLDLPPEYSNPDNAAYCIIPVPFDRTSTWNKGADKGPYAIIEASANLELYDIETDTEVYTRGIYTHYGDINLTQSQLMVDSVNFTVKEILNKNMMPIVIGGEHSVSIGPVQAIKERHVAKTGLTVLQLDAHADLRDEFHGSKLNHACVMARIKELFPIVQVGIRSMDASERAVADNERIFYAERIHDKPGWQSEVLKQLSENVYITIDLDVFDPSLMPSTGTPEPGGLSWYPVLELLKEVCRQKNLVGFDVTELCPNVYKASNFLAAKLIYKLISYHAAYSGIKK